MEQADRVYVEKVYVALKKLRPLIRVILTLDRELGLRLTRHLDALEAEVRASL